MKRDAYILLPRTSLGSLLFAAIVRDTRDAPPEAAGYFNCFPATPLCAITWVREGAIHLVDEGGKIATAPLPQVFVTGPFDGPMMSWSAGPVCAMTVGVYPDAWRSLTGVAVAVNAPAKSLDDALGPDLQALLRAVGDTNDLRQAFERLQDELESRWRETRPKRLLTPPRLEDWIGSLAARAAMSGAGDSTRQIQRRIKSWTGRTMRDLRRHARVERLFSRSLTTRGATLAEIAADAGYSDQSHMGREVRRMTGESPARMKTLVDRDNRYWVYRLFDDRR